MPKIRITEADRTGRVQASAVSNVVYLPIRFNIDGSTQITKETDGIGVFSGIALFKSAADFKDAATKTVTLEIPVEGGETEPKAVAIIDQTTLGYKLCYHLLNIGFEVLVEALDDSSEPNWEALKDRSLYDVRFLTLGALKEGGFDMTGEYQDMISTAADRGDCIALVNADESGTFDYTVSTVRGEFAGYTGGEYAAAFTPWFYTTNSDFTTADKVKIPAAFGYLFAYANATKNAPEWYAMAGFERGVIPELTDVCHAFTTAEVEVLQGRSGDGEVELDDSADNTALAINPICYVRPAGNIIYGNRTMAAPNASKGLTAQSFLNIRNGLSALKKVMYEASRKYTFEQNTETLWINFQSYITPLLDRMQSGNGILGYTFVKQKTDAKARLKAKLTIIPVEAVEDFDLHVELADSLNVSE